MTNRIERDVHIDLRRTAAVAADYKSLQGIGGIVTGLAVAAMALGFETSGLILLIVGIAASEAWYRKKFGRVRTRPDLLPTVLLVAAVLVTFLVGYGIDQAFGAPLLALPLCGALFLAASHRLMYPHVGVTRAHWAVVALLTLCSLLPLLGVPASSGPVASLLVLAAACVVIGVVDHVRLVRSMKPVPHE